VLRLLHKCRKPAGSARAGDRRRRCISYALPFPSLSERGAYGGRDPAALLDFDVGQTIAHEVHGPLTYCDLARRLLQALMGVADHQLDATRATLSRRLEELGPEWLAWDGPTARTSRRADGKTVLYMTRHSRRIGVYTLRLILCCRISPIRHATFLGKRSAKDVHFIDALNLCKTIGDEL
jgi:hypothetical protein